MRSVYIFLGQGWMTGRIVGADEAAEVADPSGWI